MQEAIIGAIELIAVLVLIRLVHKGLQVEWLVLNFLKLVTRSDPLSTWKERRLGLICYMLRHLAVIHHAGCCFHQGRAHGNLSTFVLHLLGWLLRPLGLGLQRLHLPELLVLLEGVHGHDIPFVTLPLEEALVQEAVHDVGGIVHGSAGFTANVAKPRMTSIVLRFAWYGTF